MVTWLCITKDETVFLTLNSIVESVLHICLASIFVHTGSLVLRFNAFKIFERYIVVSFRVEIFELFIIVTWSSDICLIILF